MGQIDAAFLPGQTRSGAAGSAAGADNGIRWQGCGGAFSRARAGDPGGRADKGRLGGRESNGMQRWIRGPAGWVLPC